MHYKKEGSSIILRVDKGEEVIDELTKVAIKENIKAADVSGIGALSKATIGFFEAEKKNYISKELEGDYELTSLLGNITELNNKPYIHLHAVLSDQNLNCYGGHLNSAEVIATCEIIINILPGKIDREYSTDIGLNLIKDYTFK